MSRTSRTRYPTTITSEIHKIGDSIICAPQKLEQRTNYSRYCPDNLRRTDPFSLDDILTVAAHLLRNSPAVIYWKWVQDFDMPLLSKWIHKHFPHAIAVFNGPGCFTIIPLV